MSKRIHFNFFLYLLMTFFCGFFTSCKEENKVVSKESYQEKRAVSLSQELEIPEEKVVRLLPKAKEETSEWLEYKTAEAEVNNFETYSIQEVVNRATSIKDIMQALSETIPKDFQIKPVLARINVLMTLASVLEQTATNPTATSEEIRIPAKKIPVAFRNLKIQLNEAFRKGVEDFQLELEVTDTLKKPIPKSRDTVKKPILKPTFLKSKSEK